MVNGVFMFRERVVPASAPRGAWAKWPLRRCLLPPRLAWWEPRGCGSRVGSSAKRWRPHPLLSEGLLWWRNQSCWISWRQQHCGKDRGIRLRVTLRLLILCVCLWVCVCECVLTYSGSSWKSWGSASSSYSAAASFPAKTSSLLGTIT